MMWKIGISVLCLGLLAACAQPARVQNMVANRTAAVLPADSPLKEAICVAEVTGGEETNPLWTSEVDNAGFAGALTASLRNNSLLGPSDERCAYDLNANLLGLAQPIMGFDLTVTSNINYSVIERSNQIPYFQTTVQKPFTADFSSSLLAIERLRLANEGAIKDNIAEFIRRLLDHTPPPDPAPAAPAGKPTS
jgi:hypothetical protein